MVKEPNLNDFLLRADESSEMMADQGMEVIREARTMMGLTDPIPDPVTISHKNLRLMLRAVYKAGAAFGFEEIINILRAVENER